MTFRDWLILTAVVAAAFSGTLAFCLLHWG
jgi:hypothetical protein